jgi:hypothetical protein
MGGGWTAGLAWTNGEGTVDRRQVNEVGWFPAGGSYEEAVLSWHEQIEMSFRRRELAARRTAQEPPMRRGEQPRSQGATTAE